MRDRQRGAPTLPTLTWNTANLAGDLPGRGQAWEQSQQQPLHEDPLSSPRSQGDSQGAVPQAQLALLPLFMVLETQSPPSREPELCSTAPLMLGHRI